MPSTVVEQEWTNASTGNTIGGWTRVHDPHHEFKGDMIVDNGLIRLSQGYKNIPDVTDASDISQPRITGYSDGMWNDNLHYYFHYWASGIFSFVVNDPLVIKKVGKYSVVLQGRVTRDDNFISYEIYLTNGSPFALVKLTDWKTSANIRIALQTKPEFAGSGYLGHDQSNRFACISLDTVGDASVETGDVAGSETEGLSVGFSTQNNQLVMFFDSSSTNGWVGEIDAANDIFEFLYSANGIDFDADSPAHYWAIGLMAFDTSNLQWQQDDNTIGGDGEWTAGTNTVTADPTGGAAGSYVIELVDNGKHVYRDITLPSGSYRVWLHVYQKTAVDGTLRMYMHEADNTGDTYFTMAAHSTWYWRYIDIIVGSDNTVHLYCTATGNAAPNSFYIDEPVIIPISNSKNFPCDYRDQMLANITISEGLTDE